MIIFGRAHVAHTEIDFKRERTQREVNVPNDRAKFVWPPDLWSWKEDAFTWLDLGFSFQLLTILFVVYARIIWQMKKKKKEKKNRKFVARLRKKNISNFLKKDAFSDARRGNLIERFWKQILETKVIKSKNFVAYLAGSAYSSASTISPMLTENPSVSFL